MPGFDGFFQLLQSRSFTSIWFWLMLALLWTLAGRNVVGVPDTVVRAVRRQSHPRAALTLLDWLSLTLPERLANPGEWAVMVAIGAFMLSSLAVLGFAFGFEMAQALALLLIPLGVVALLRQRLVRQLSDILRRAAGGGPAEAAAAEAARKIVIHRYLCFTLSVFAVVGTAFWGALHTVINRPLGF